MAQYTQFIINCRLKDETPCEVIKCLEDMVNDIDNDLFTFTRNPLDNYCESNEYPKSFVNLILKAHGHIKNYWNDINAFVDFIKPHVEIGFLEDGAFAKSLYEENDEWNYYNIQIFVTYFLCNI